MDYFNEIDPYAAQWIRNLIDAGHLPRGVVDTRSIVDVTPGDLAGFRQCHFFAGIGVWALALRRTGMSEVAGVWTGSCPCQPFSSAGAGAGMDDERHLWPHFQHLIGKRRPAIVYGEQVASKDAEPWLDLVHTDMEALGYAFGAVAFPSAGVGAPHIRDRTYWVAHADGGAGRQGSAQPWPGPGSSSVPDRLGDAHHQGLEGYAGDGGHARRSGASGPIAAAGVSGGVGESDDGGRQSAGLSAQRIIRGDQSGVERHGEIGEQRTPAARSGEGIEPAALAGAGPTNGLWRDADWLLCRDGKWRPVSPGTFPLVNGAPARVGRLRAYGNAINLEAARVFIEATLP